MENNEILCEQFTRRNKFYSCCGVDLNNRERAANAMLNEENKIE